MENDEARGEPGTWWTFEVGNPPEDPYPTIAEGKIEFPAEASGH